MTINKRHDLTNGSLQSQNTLIRIPTILKGPNIKIKKIVTSYITTVESKSFPCCSHCSVVKFGLYKHHYNIIVVPVIYRSLWKEFPFNSLSFRVNMF